MELLIAERGFRIQIPEIVRMEMERHSHLKIFHRKYGTDQTKLFDLNELKNLARTSLRFIDNAVEMPNVNYERRSANYTTIEYTDNDGIIIDYCKFKKKKLLG